ncbi:MAG: hypothetical protein HOV79_16955 [Hamadaea sp.]|nr:hypothetical protein [Hamadaea sp.]
MTAVRIHRYSVDPARLDDLLARRARLIDGIRSGFPGLTATTLVKLDDGSYMDTWHWESAELMGAALAAAAGFPAVSDTLGLTGDHVVHGGEVIDQR